jgi:hypothetical protein
MTQLTHTSQGSLSFYPINLEPIYASHADRIPGFPNTGSLQNLLWHVPSRESVVAMLPLIKAATTDTMEVCHTTNTMCMLCMLCMLY